MEKVIQYKMKKGGARDTRGKKQFTASRHSGICFSLYPTKKERDVILHKKTPRFFGL